MSTKSSIFLTRDREHWYYDHKDDSITIEIEKSSIQEDFTEDNDGPIVVEIKKDCDLWRYLNHIRGHDFEAVEK